MPDYGVIKNSLEIAAQKAQAARELASLMAEGRVADLDLSATQQSTLIRRLRALITDALTAMAAVTKELGV